ncbi:MAG: TetR/AcrR family transcriptional regulator [Candidatus Nanopelagicales bacterium]
MARGVGQHHGDLRQALISAALDLIADSDADEVTLRAVARHAGVSSAAPYHHFLDKNALLAAVARDGFEALSRVQLEVLAGPGSAQDRLERLVTAYVVFALRHPTHYRLMFRTSPSRVEGAEAEPLREVARSTFGRLVNAVNDVNPQISVDEAARLALVGWATAHGAVEVSQWAAGLVPGLDAEEFAAEVGRSVCRLASAN